jgi:hypothetical protein
MKANYKTYTDKFYIPPADKDTNTNLTTFNIMDQDGYSNHNNRPSIIPGEMESLILEE